MLYFIFMPVYVIIYDIYGQNYSRRGYEDMYANMNEDIPPPMNL